MLKPGVYTLTGKVPGTQFQPKATVTVRATAKIVPVPERLVESFPLGQVVLDQDTKGRDTQFIKNRDKFIRTLAATNPDSFLYNFRATFGQKQPEGAKPLGGWDSETTRLRGHATGHYLSAIAQAYAGTTYNESLQANCLQKMNYLIDVLYDLSQKSGKPAPEDGKFNADPITVPPGPGRKGYDSDLRSDSIRTDYWNWGKGFISAYPPDQFIMLEQGAIYGSQNTQIWAPYYTLHKILAGLLDCYEVGGNRKALEIAGNMGAWVYARLKVLPIQTRISMWNRYIAGEYGGMNEVLARLYRLTKDKQFLECAKLFDNINFFFGNAAHEHGLAMNVDTIRVPRWATRGFFIKINGRELPVKALPSTYLTLHRAWRDSDTIELRVPFHFYLDPVMDRPNIASIFYGPILLAAQETDPRTDWRPVTLELGEIGKSVAGDPGTLRFIISDIVLKPFYEWFARYSVYLQVKSK